MRLLSGRTRRPEQSFFSGRSVAISDIAPGTGAARAPGRAKRAPLRSSSRAGRAPVTTPLPRPCRNHPLGELLPARDDGWEPLPGLSHLPGPRTPCDRRWATRKECQAVSGNGFLARRAARAGWWGDPWSGSVSALRTDVGDRPGRVVVPPLRHAAGPVPDPCFQRALILLCRPRWKRCEVYPSISLARYHGFLALSSLRCGQGASIRFASLDRLRPAARCLSAAGPEVGWC